MRAAERKKQLGKFPYFRIEMSILNGRELIAMDRGGTSDPYVKVVQVKIMDTQTVFFKLSKESQKGEEELARWLRRQPGTTSMRDEVALRVTYGEHTNSEIIRALLEQERALIARLVADFSVMFRTPHRTNKCSGGPASR